MVIGNSKKTEKILEKEQLFSLIDQYEGILNKEIIDYFKSLVKLEVSALDNNIISLNVLDKVSDLKLYRNIVIYNIYYRSLNLFEKQNKGLKIDKNNILKIDGSYNSENNFKIFGFNYEDGIPTMNLYETVEDREKRSHQIRIYQDKLENLKRQSCCRGKSVEGPISSWQLDTERDIFRITRQIQELEERSSLDKKGIYIAETQEYFKDVLLDDCGLSNDDFKEDNFLLRPENVLDKSLVKKYPYTTISRNIKYY